MPRAPKAPPPPADGGPASGGAHSSAVRFGSGHGPGLYPHLYFALTVHNVLVVAAVYSPATGDPVFGRVLAALFAVVTPLAGALRLSTQDAYASLRTSGRFFTFTLPLFFIVAPIFIPGRSILPDGLVFYLLTTTLLAMDVRPIRYHLAVSLVLFWFGLAGPDAPGMPWILGVGATTVWSLSALHFASVGEDFGLRGWWAVGRVLQTVALFMIPSGGAVWLITEGWPVPPDRVRPERGRSITAEEVWRRLAEMDPTDMAELARRIAFSLLVILLTLIVLYYLRRLMASRGQVTELPWIPGTDVSEVEYTKAEPRMPAPRVPGVRGAIISQWWRWARWQRDKGLLRRDADTAREFGDAVRDRSADPEAVDRLTELMDRAHYGAAEPTVEDLEEMRRLTLEEHRRG